MSLKSDLMSVIDTIISAGITGIGAGLGTSIGTYFSNKLILKHLDKIEEKLITRKPKRKNSVK
jgi:hypothetical protein